MITLAVTFYDVVLWLHITAVVVGFGSTFAYAVLPGWVAQNSPRAMPGLLRAMTANDRSLVTIGGVVVLLSGIYLAADRWEFSDFFIGWGILTVIVLLGLTGALFIPNERRAADAADRDIERAGSGPVEFGPEFEKANRKMMVAGPLTGLLIVLTIYVMTAKPFL
jgi:MFS family permease